MFPLPFLLYTYTPTHFLPICTCMHFTFSLKIFAGLGQAMPKCVWKHRDESIKNFPCAWQSGNSTSTQQNMFKREIAASWSLCNRDTRISYQEVWLLHQLHSKSCCLKLQRVGQRTLSQFLIVNTNLTRQNSFFLKN